jgi:hypothetical protein
LRLYGKSPDNTIIEVIYGKFPDNPEFLKIYGKSPDNHSDKGDIRKESNDLIVMPLNYQWGCS